MKPGRREEQAPIITTLANLFAALQEEVPPQHDRLVVQIVTEMLTSGRLKIA